MAQQTTPAPVASLPPPPPIPESRVLTTDQIQKYLDENKQLILAILDNQNLGKLSESAQYQAQLQRNLLFLAALADEQPQTKAIRAQMMPQGVVPQHRARQQWSKSRQSHNRCSKIHKASHHRIQQLRTNQLLPSQLTLLQ